MDLLKAQLERIQKQLAGLSASQKMLVAALAAIMVITVVWWGKYAGEAEMVPLLNQAFSAPDLGRVQDELSARGIPYTVSTDKLMVPADRRMEALSDLTYARKMPRNTQEGFDAIVKEMSPFDSQDKQQKIWMHGREAILSQVIGSWPGVAQADVIIDTTSVQRVEGSIEPRATVNITTQDGAKSPQGMADAAVEAVDGAVAGLDPKRIKVVINGRAQRVHDGQDPLANGADQLALLQQDEAFAELKIRRNFEEIPNILVTVTMKLNTSSVQSEKHDYDPKKAVQKTIQTTTETDQTNAAGAGGEAGAVPNTGANIGPAGGGAGGTTTVHEKTEEKNQVFMSEERTTSSTPAGDAVPVSATVRVPLSHFARVLQWQTGSTKQPTSAELQPVIDTELAKMRQAVASCVGLPAPDKVSISWYVDTFPSLSTPPVASTSPGLSQMVGGHAKEIALGTLAVMSLFMVSMMVRKATPAPLPAAMASGGLHSDKAAANVPVALMSGELLAGEAAEGEGHLEGMELSDDTVKAGRMVDQVSTLVREDPEAAAALVKRWLGRA
jgi:flagellar M-ring protein FliF